MKLKSKQSWETWHLYTTSSTTTKKPRECTNYLNDTMKMKCKKNKRSRRERPYLTLPLRAHLPHSTSCMSKKLLWKAIVSCYDRVLLNCVFKKVGKSFKHGMRASGQPESLSEDELLIIMVAKLLCYSYNQLVIQILIQWNK